MLWKKLKVLGSGSYGTVSLAASTNVDSSSTIYAAVKSAEVSRSSSLQEEGKILQALRGSEYVVECFGEDVSVENGKNTYNLMLEYAAGGTLHDLICKSNMSLRESEAAYYAFQLLEGISHVHNKGFIHCDLKPANILVFPPTEKYMRLKLADFGLSLKSTETHDDSSKKHPHHHRGTLAYASPESVTSEVYTKDVDIWALGCIVIEMIAGRRVWSGYKSNYELALKIAHEEPEIPYNISKDAKDFLSKCLERDYNQRWTAEMLLNHPFIIKNMNVKKMYDDDVLIRKCNWISTEHLFSTISRYHPDHNSSSSSSRVSSSNISSSETNSCKAQHTIDDEDYVLGIWDLINLLFA
ncbi:hypothetical protein RDI58_020494 [Solanum bulbocastanum]|uniref:Protein kinase domain-containing protein n=1 Tax=Solanum bulbocastanum TaxID=147425 RepID=A0AAN8YAQ8_SOLBU